MSHAARPPRIKPPVSVSFALILTLIIALMVPAQRAYAASLVVNSTGDADDANPADGICATAGSVCTLRAAIETANALGGTNTISFDGATFATPKTITLTSNLHVSTGTLTITGTGTVTVDGGGVTQLLLIDSAATVSLSDLTLAHGSTNSNGGGIDNAGTLTVTNSTFSGNVALFNGGGIENTGTLTVTNSSFSGNSAGNYGAGIYNFNDALMVTNSTFYGNRANFTGGGIYTYAGTLTVN